jgi:TrmH family RNA methyltransferase
MPDAELIRSRSNPLVKRLRALRDHGDDDGLVALIEGPKLLEEAALSGVEILEVATTPRGERSARGHRLIRELAIRGAPVRLVHPDVLASLSEAESSQGVVALARRPSFREADLHRGTPLLIVAIAIQNPGNLGGLLRTAEAAGASGAYLTKGCADPFSWKALRGSMGSAFRLPHVSGADLREVQGRLRESGIKTIAAVTAGPTRYDEADLRRPVALLLGNEGAGLPEHVVREADLSLTIPLEGGVESLNVAVAAGVLLFEAARQRRRSQTSQPSRRRVG